MSVMRSWKRNLRKASTRLRSSSGSGGASLAGHGTPTGKPMLPVTEDTDTVFDDESVYSLSPDEPDARQFEVLTQLIKQFSDSMNMLLSAMASEQPPTEKKIQALHVLDTVLSHVQQTALTSGLDWESSVYPCASSLLDLIEGWDPAAQGGRSPDGFADAADALLKTYTKSISSFLNGDEEDEDQDDDTVSTEEGMKESRVMREGLLSSLTDRDDSVSVLLARAKQWSRYAKEVIGYLKTRAQMELDMHKKLQSLTNTTLGAISEYSTQACHDSFGKLLKGHLANGEKHITQHSGPMQFLHLQPLMEARTNHEKTRKQLKETWAKECRKVTDCTTAMNKAKAKYTQSCLDWEKSLQQRLKEEQSKYKLKLEKRAREEAELRLKVDDCRRGYCEAVAIVNDSLEELHNMRTQIVASLSASLFAAGSTLKECLTVYQADELSCSQPCVKRLMALVDVFRADRPDKTEYQALHDSELRGEAFVIPPPYAFQPFDLDAGLALFLEQSGESNRCIDTESEPSPTKPLAVRKVTAKDVASLPNMHAFVKHNIPSKCRHCKHACYFHCVQCTKCGVISHKKCIELLEVPCNQVATGTRLRRLSSVWGSPLAAQTPELIDGVPIIVRRLTEEIENTGIDSEGLYRVSGVKSRVENLCAEFEANPRGVVTDGIDVHVLSAVLKLYFRQLPEAVVPVESVGSFLAVARDRLATFREPGSEELAVAALAKLLEALPAINYSTLAYTIRHLSRVAEHHEENKMKPSNLGIVFGPTLLRSESDSLDTLMHMPLQTKAVEMMIANFEAAFKRFVERDAQTAAAASPAATAAAAVRRRQPSRERGMAALSVLAEGPEDGGAAAELAQAKLRTLQRSRRAGLVELVDGSFHGHDLLAGALPPAALEPGEGEGGSGDGPFGQAPPPVADEGESSNSSDDAEEGGGMPPADMLDAPPPAPPPAVLPSELLDDVFEGPPSPSSPDVDSPPDQLPPPPASADLDGEEDDDEDEFCLV